MDEKFRGEAYKEMTKVFLEYLPWIPVIQPYEDYGLQKYVEWTANPNQQFEIRKFNFKLRRAYGLPHPPPSLRDGRRPRCADSSRSSASGCSAR